MTFIQQRITEIIRILHSYKVIKILFHDFFLNEIKILIKTKFKYIYP